MSADNWTSCPRCLAVAKRDAEEKRKTVEESYGKIPAAEFVARQQALRAGEVEIDANFREDYEFYGAEDGEVHYSYSGRCQDCGLSVDLRGSRRFYPDQEGGGR